MTITPAILASEFAKSRRKRKPVPVYSGDGDALFTSESIQITMPLPPTINHLYATFRGRRVKSAEARQYKQHVGILIAAAISRWRSQYSIAHIGTFFGEEPLSVSLDFYRPTRAGDIDGRVKACLDSMTGVVYADDRQVSRLVVQNFVDAANPRVVVEVTV